MVICFHQEKIFAEPGIEKRQDGRCRAIGKQSTSHRHPYSVKRDWFKSLVQKADKAHHRDAVCDDYPNDIFIDMLSGGPSGSTTNKNNIPKLTREKPKINSSSSASIAVEMVRRQRTLSSALNKEHNNGKRWWWNERKGNSATALSLFSDGARFPASSNLTSQTSAKEISGPITVVFLPFSPRIKVSFTRSLIRPRVPLPTSIANVTTTAAAYWRLSYAHKINMDFVMPNRTADKEFEVRMPTIATSVFWQYWFQKQQ
ncbi:uncharacterized protein EV420DRAFT_1483893 [Desarmillaria tabescens]|uniref:Uncharacterized protein n=1 Tax=Armillaria tabescens TaxID=1929756 RepID=A0AA39JQC6_ARMTA|nr:uncharacterized protein EV420DRAFT_1483893 [Desarmillaria tabescens]KAK0446991.1 hypothetical protein EV420DRAFT_1483893 [Desarmillaria tabescens]